MHTARLIDDILRDHDIHHVAYEDIKSSEESRLKLLSFLGLESSIDSFKIPAQIVNPNVSLVSMKLINKDEAVEGFEERQKIAPLDVIV